MAAASDSKGAAPAKPASAVVKMAKPASAVVKMANSALAPAAKKPAAAVTTTYRSATLNLRGVAAPADKFGRLRFLVLDEPGHRAAAAALRALPRLGSQPYALYATPREGVIGEFWVVVPAPSPTRGLRGYADLVLVHAARRGRDVLVEARTRHTVWKGAHGTALDLVDLEIPAETKK